jgi:protein-S-isoprenylcysteine O-methyltransferase Ste14
MRQASAGKRGPYQTFLMARRQLTRARSRDAGLPIEDAVTTFGPQSRGPPPRRRETTMPVSLYIQSIGFVILTAVALFASAGTVAIAGFWIYLALYAAAFVVSPAILDADLLRERMRPGGQRPPMALRIVTVILFVHWIVAGLDRGRFHWSDTVPIWLQAAGLIVTATSWVLVLWAMRTNRFFSSVARIQSDRGQHVITTGPYAFVRHPGYLAGFAMIVASGLALGSWLATVVLVIPCIPGLIVRAVGEDRMLHAELPGYRDYASHVRWRVFPGVW